MADTVNEAIQCTVYSNILLHSAITVPVLTSTNTVPKPSLQSTLNATSIKILQKHTHADLHFNSHVFRNQEGEQIIMKLQSALLQINFLPITCFCNIYSLTPFQNTSCSPVFQNCKQCISWVMIFQDVISLLCFYNTQ